MCVKILKKGEIPRAGTEENFKEPIFEGLRERKSKGAFHGSFRAYRRAASCGCVFCIAAFLRRGCGVAQHMRSACKCSRSERVKCRRAFRSCATAVYLIRAAPAASPQTSRSQKRIAACRRNTSRKSVFQREICKSMSRCIAAGSPPHLKFI